MRPASRMLMPGSGPRSDGVSAVMGGAGVGVGAGVSGVTMEIPVGVDGAGLAQVPELALAPELAQAPEVFLAG